MESQEKTKKPTIRMPFKNVFCTIHREILPKGTTISGHLSHTRAARLLPDIQFSSPMHRSPDLVRGRELKQGFSCMIIKVIYNLTRPWKYRRSHSSFGKTPNSPRHSNRTPTLYSRRPTSTVKRTPCYHHAHSPRHQEGPACQCGSCSRGS